MRVPIWQGVMPISAQAGRRSLMSDTNVFPSTDRTDLAAMLAGAPEQRLAAVRLLLGRYADPLAVYARGSSLRTVADPIELVQGFLTDRLLRDDYLRKWLDSGMALRRWLINGLHLYAKETRRADQRHAQLDAAYDVHSQRVPEAEAAWSRALLMNACDHVESELRRSGHDTAWEIFRRHFIDGRSYRELASEFDINAAAMAESSRRVSCLLREAVRLLLVREGVAPEDVEGELYRMLEALEEHR